MTARATPSSDWAVAPVPGDSSRFTDQAAPPVRGDSSPPPPAGQPAAPAPGASAPGTADQPAAPVPRDSSPAPRFTALVLRSEGPALAGLGPALALRVPTLPVVSEAPAGGAPYVFVAVRSDPELPVRHQIGVITSDGAAYFREVDTGAEPPARVLASVLANLLVSIAEGTIRPDRTDVEIPPEGVALPTLAGLSDFEPILKRWATSPGKHGLSGEQLASMAAGMLAGTVGNVQAAICIAVSHGFKNHASFKSKLPILTASFMHDDRVKKAEGTVAGWVMEALCINPPAAFLPRGASSLPFSARSCTAPSSVASSIARSRGRLAMRLPCWT